MINNERLVIELTVRNNPGTMSHITGLFSRRAFNLEGILCGEIGDGKESMMYLLVKNNEQIEQIVKQLRKLYNVLNISVLDNYNPKVFLTVGDLIKGTINI